MEHFIFPHVIETSIFLSIMWHKYDTIQAFEMFLVSLATHKR